MKKIYLLKEKLLKSPLIGIYLVTIGCSAGVIEILISLFSGRFFSFSLVVMATVFIFIGTVFMIIEIYQDDKRQQKILEDFELLVDFYREKRKREIFQEIQLKVLLLEMENLFNGNDD